ncbi:MAG: AIPR family protein [Planctomycetaceae bacterium]|jgi:hypothetical protein|nr:AIPR family protein [Planctomycetaceae bacterium]
MIISLQTVFITMTPKITYSDYVKEWIKEIESDNPSTREKGLRFSKKLITQWLDIDEDDDNITYCDGTADGGIDIAYLDKADANNEEDDIASGDTWYLIQSKYGSAFRGKTSLYDESIKVIDTIDGKRPNLNSLSQGIKDKLSYFRMKAKAGYDKIVLVFATVEPLTSEQQRFLQIIQTEGQKQLEGIFNVESVSIRTIFDRLENPVDLTIPLKISLQKTSDELWLGTTRLLDLYEFLKNYKAKTSDLDQLFEKNVRKFLGSRKKVNMKIQKTLKGEDDNENPRYFGLYNNGITFVVKDIVESRDKNNDVIWTLHNPFIVNGCQTTRSIWEVFQSKLDSGGSNESQIINAWKKEVEQAIVVTKIAKIGEDNNKLLLAITRHTNSQNAVAEKDFISLDDNFKEWAEQMKKQYKIYLETQRGGWDSERTKRLAFNYKDHANAFDLLKVFAAGWLSEAGAAFGRNAAFVPDGSIFKKIIGKEGADNNGDMFGVEDLFAAYNLSAVAKQNNFGRGAEQIARRQSKFLFYSIFVGLIKWMLEREGFPSGLRDISKAINILSDDKNKECYEKIIQAACAVIDNYFSNAETKSIYNEDTFKDDFNNNINGYLKWEKIGKSEKDCPNLFYRIDIEKAVLQKKNGSKKSPIDLIIETIKGK